ncbi:P1 family peptidase [Cupriavidus basilensis]
MILATDAPLDARQLRRLSLRAGAGLARTGSVFGHGSGDIALAFPPPTPCRSKPARRCRRWPCCMKPGSTRCFHAAADSVEQAILHALWQAETVHGRDGHQRVALRELMPGLPQWLQRTAPAN